MGCDTNKIYLVLDYLSEQIFFPPWFQKYTTDVYFNFPIFIHRPLFGIRAHFKETVLHFFRLK